MYPGDVPGALKRRRGAPTRAVEAAEDPPGEVPGDASAEVSGVAPAE